MGWRDNLRNPKNLGVIRGPHGHASQPHLSVHAKGGRIGKFGGGRTNLLEQLGRVEAERSNPNRRAEISRVHGELNRGYAKGGRAGLKHGGKPWGAGPKPGTHEFMEHVIHKPRKKKAIGGPAARAIKKGVGKALEPKGVFKKDSYKRPWEKPPQLRKSQKERREELRKKARKSGGHSKIVFADEWKHIDPGLQKGLFKKEGGRIGLKHGFQILGGGIKGKPHSTREGRDDAGRRKFKRWVGEDPSDRNRDFIQRARRMARAGRGKDFRTHGRDVPTMAAKGGRIGLKKGGSDKKWMQKVSASIKKRGTKGKCTPITKPGCTGRAKALAKTFKKIAAKRKA
jgi:hypothetical protein